ncbi:MAG: Mediator of RNA polymerase II transcription subunit 7 [Claussenomyces sp. TS43310]|nr:MAG: Mediator of RNA polymerase II transcription subunit 7 [Claussenomyces sp. TS43310]
MAEQQQANALAAAFPSPPPFYQHFTPENIDRIATIRADHPADSSQLQSEQQKMEDEAQSKPLRILDLPSELRFLQPPAPPSEKRYRSFGDFYDLNEALPSLREHSIEQLYTPPSTPPNEASAPVSSPHSDRALILKRLAKSLLLNFLELMGIMSISPEQYADKISDLRTLFINFHHLLNEYRPHQARESLILMMEEQLGRSNAETEGIERIKEKVEDMLAGLGQVKLPDGAGDAYADSQQRGEDKSTKAIWDQLDKEFG